MFCSQFDIESTLKFLSELKFSQSLGTDLAQSAIDALNGGLRCNELRAHLRETVPTESFALQEVSAEQRFYGKFRVMLNALDIPTPNVRSNEDMIVKLILHALYDEEEAEKTFATVKENRKTMNDSLTSDKYLYVSESSTRPLISNAYAGNPLPPNVLTSLPADKLREILGIILSHTSTFNENSTNLNYPKPYATKPNEQRFKKMMTDADDPLEPLHPHEPIFRLETALGRL